MTEHAHQGAPRATWSGRMAFVLAAAASAIGLGNLWRFPALAARYGGGAFVVTYLVLVCTLGFAYMLTEAAIGRRSQRAGIAAFASMAASQGRTGWGWRLMGLLEIVVPAIIVPYYCAIGGWIMKYMFSYLTGGSPDLATAGFFGSFISGAGSSAADPIAWTLLFAVAVMLVIALGVNRGIEKLNKVAMPTLLILSIVIIVYCLVALPNALDGVAYFLIPKVEDFSAMTVVAAAGQMFYSLSLAMGIMVAYGSYMRREEHLEGSVRRIEFFDTLVAILAGLMIIPAAYSFGMANGGASLAAEVAEQKGASLMFVTMPQVFETMPGAGVIGFLFFLLVFFAALTSAVSLTEAVVSGVADAAGLPRGTSVKFTGIGLVLLSLLPTLGYSVWAGFAVPVGNTSMQILDFADFISNSVIMPALALAVSIAVGWVVGPQYVSEEVEQGGASFKGKRFYIVLIKYVVPVLLLVILATSIMNSIGLLEI